MTEFNIGDVVTDVTLLPLGVECKRIADGFEITALPSLSEVLADELHEVFVSAWATNGGAWTSVADYVLEHYTRKPGPEPESVFDCDGDRWDKRPDGKYVCMDSIDNTPTLYVEYLDNIKEKHGPIFDTASEWRRWTLTQ